MRKFAAVLVFCAFAFVAALSGARVSSASPGIGSGPYVVGATEDAELGMDDGGAAMYDQMQSYGLGVIRMSVFWDGTATFTDKAAIARAIAPALSRNMRVLFSLAPAKGHAADMGSADGATRFASFAVGVAQAFPQVIDIIVGNEPNLQLFNFPSWSGTTPIGAMNYERLLATTYDALHSFNPNIDVIGVATSPRGNDPTATSNVGIPPVRFIDGMGTAYKASARSAPIADNVAMHPYPNPNQADDPPTKGYQWPNAGVPNLDRLDQAWWDAFNGTGQPLFQEDGTQSAGFGGFVKWVLDETAWQANTQNFPFYTGTEPTKTVDEATQAQYHAQVVSRFACDKRVAGLLFFHWIDETDRDRFQSGFLRADKSVRPVADAVKGAIAAGCTASPTTWKHSTGVSGASGDFHGRNGFLFYATAQEDVNYTAGVYKASKAARKAKLGRPVATASGLLKAYYTAGIKFPGKLKPGSYVYSIKLTAALNPVRSVTFTSKPFRRK